MDHFTVTIPSNDKCDEDNTIASFDVTLPRRIHLDGSWEVGVQGISYTRSWFNVTKEAGVRVVKDDGSIYSSPSKIKPGFYPSEASLVTAVNCALEGMWTFFMRKNTTLPSIVFDPISRRVSVTMGKSNYAKLYLEMDEEISDILGLKYEYQKEFYDVSEMNPEDVHIQRSRIKGVTNSFRHYDLHAGVRSIFLYSNIVSNSIVGSQLTSLLKVVPIPSEKQFGDQVNLDFNPIEYQPVNTTYLQDISISLLDDSGRVIPFKFGRTIVKLHFKRDESLRELLY